MIIGVNTHKGKSRINNQDALFVSKDEGFPLFIVADGMGGHKAGEIASNMAIDIIQKSMWESKEKMDNEEDIMNIIKNSIREANKKIFLKSFDGEKYSGMGTTTTLAYIGDDKVFIGHVGDSRAYIIRENSMKQITEDHSLVNELIKNGSITKEEAKNHPQKNMITKAVGTSVDLEIDLIKESYQDNDILLLCSDGLTNMVGEMEILEIFSSDEDLQEICNKLIFRANKYGGLDNITVIAIKF